MGKLLKPEEYRALIKEKIPDGLIVPEHDEHHHYYRYTPTGVKSASVTTKAGILDSPHLKKWAARLAVEHIDKNWDVLMLPNTDRQKFFDSAVLVHQDVFEEAGDVGTAGHKVVEKYLLDWIETGVKPPDIRAFIEDGADGRIHAIARSAELFIRDFDAVPVVSELLVFSPKYVVGGTLDGLMILSRVLKKGTDVTNLFGEIGCPHESWWLPKKRRPNVEECMTCGKVVERIFALTDWKTSNAIDKPEYAMQVSTYSQCVYELTGLKPTEILIVRFDKWKAHYEVLRVVDRVAAFRAFTHVAKVFDWLENGKHKLLPYTPKVRASLDEINFTPV